ncbi:hypothetical protein [Alkalihalobacillus sp. LMS39]|uniref:hypothetical protein n=1 Tax=Alkalihalobacillus sp. LMS39 TaxID=2924032 RepID=UPI001FB364DB|nr:hypothetical protein [Alkalihalobacillus sp. LMS39]UOE95084.1 hypothetical protein MM271_05495 [Alkalihalobacillus sp. LMS39]
MVLSVNDLSFISETVEENYDISIYKIERNPLNGFLGDTYIINNKYVLKIPKRGGDEKKPQGNVKFSTYVMNEAQLHGIHAPINIKTRNGELYGFNKKLNYFHLMEKIHTNSEEENKISTRQLSFLLGYHSSIISLLTSNITKAYKFKEKDYYDHWSLEASISKLKSFFGVEDNMNYLNSTFVLEKAKENLGLFKHVPATLRDQIEHRDPIRILELAKEIKNKKNRNTRKFVIHSDIKPENLLFGYNNSTKMPEVQGSFDYTFSCLANPAKNIANTIVDSFIGITRDYKINYEEILEIAKGVLFVFQLNKEEIFSIEDEILSACIRKYTLRWEYWKNELNGRYRDYDVPFIDPKEIYNITYSFKEEFSKNSLNQELFELSLGSPSSYIYLELKEFLDSSQYWDIRMSDPKKLRIIVDSILKRSINTEEYNLILM